MPALESTVDMYDLRMSEGVRPLYEAVKTFIREEVQPMSEEFFKLGENRTDRWSYAPGQLELLEAVKDKAKANGLWNFFLPDAETGEGSRTSTTRTSRSSSARTRWLRNR